MVMAWPERWRRCEPLGRWHGAVPLAWLGHVWLAATVWTRHDATDAAHADGPRAGDSHAVTAPEAWFDALFARHERQVFGYLWRVTGDQQAASDLCQEAFLRAWRHSARVSDYAEPLAWLLRVATHLALNHRRRGATRVGLPLRLDEANSPALGDPADEIVTHDLVHRVLLALPPKLRAALVLREVYGLSYDEVAQSLGTTHAAAKMTLSRARERFRLRYQREEGQR